MMSNIATFERKAPALSFDQQVQIAKAVANSNMFGIETADQALALMSLCEAEGMHPAIAIRDYHIIKGKPALKADAMMARFQAAGGKIEWEELSDQRVCAIFSHPSGGSAKIDWDMDRARSAGFASKDNWKKFPRAMLRSRVVSEGIRTVFPGVVAGVYTVEEVNDFEEGPDGRLVSAQNTNFCTEGSTTKKTYTDSQFSELLPQWKSYVLKQNKTPDQIIESLNSKNIALTDDQIQQIKTLDCMEGEIIDG